MHFLSQRREYPKRISVSYAMRKAGLWAAVGCCVVGVSVWLVMRSSAAAPGPGGPIPPTFFGLQMHKPTVLNQPWPTIPFGAGRLWDSGVSWAEVNPSNQVYDWDLLDKWLAKYHEQGIDNLLYTFGRVPQWATSKPSDSSCAFQGRGQCDPPNDLQPDGAGPDQHWKDFVTALATHSRTSRGARIRYWEIWNEPYMEQQWTGTNAQLLRMAADAHNIILKIDPDAVLLSPSSAMKTPKQQQWMQGYLHDGGGKYADVIAFHGYIHTGRPGVYPVAADILPAVRALRKMMDDYGQGSKPIFDTEASWGRARAMGFENDEDFEAGFLAQFYLLHWSAGVSRFYWYAWNNDEFGTLWSPDESDPQRPGQLHKAGEAYEQVYDWMVEATMSSPCSVSGGGMWTCGLTRGGNDALAVWSTGGNKSYAPDGKFKKFRDLSGNTSPITGGKVSVGFKPILLQGQ